MYFYFIPPSTNLDLSLVGDRIFCLAHFYMQDENYRKFFLDIKKKYPNVWITLDNSAAERSLVTEDVLLHIVGELKPSEVIAPDVLFNKEQTIKNLESFIEKMKELEYIKHTRIFGCPQGKTKKDWLECYDHMLANPDVSVIGLSKIAVPYAFLSDPKPDQGIKEARHMAVDLLLKEGKLRKPIHFLGMGDPTEYRYYSELIKAEYVDKHILRSSDSCYTILAAVNGIDLEKSPEVRLETYEEYYHTPMTAEQYALALKNMFFLKKYTNS